MKVLQHDLQRRRLLVAGAGLITCVSFPAWTRAADEVVVAMAGTASGAHVWFRPRGLLIQPGQAVRWVNEDTGNVHTVTAYHPDNDRPLRIPEGAQPWNSNYLMPGQSYVRIFDQPGVYDYFCIPHERAGMVGRIVVGRPGDMAPPYASSDARLPEHALAGLPSVADIVNQGLIE